MIGINIGINKRRSVAGGFDADYQAVLDYATLQGYTLPSMAAQIIQNDFITGAKDEGVFNKHDLLYLPAQDGSEEFGTLNVMNPSVFQLTLVNLPTFVSKYGFQGNGTNAWLNTNWDHATDKVNAQYGDTTAWAVMFNRVDWEYRAWGNANNGSAVLLLRSGASVTTRHIAGYATTNIGFSGVGEELFDDQMAEITSTGGGTTHTFRIDGVDKQTAAWSLDSSATTGVGFLRESTSFTDRGIAMAGLCSALSSAESAALTALKDTYLTAMHAL